MKNIATLKRAALAAIAIATTLVISPAFVGRAIFAQSSSCASPPTVVSVSPSSGAADIPVDLLITGNLIQPSGTVNVTSVFAVEVGNPGNVVQASRFVVITPSIMDSLFTFGQGNACKTFRIFVNGPCGPSASTAGGQFQTLCQTPQQRIASLKDEVASLQLAGILTEEQAESLTRKLDRAIRDLNDGHDGDAAESLRDFIDRTRELVEHGVLTAAQSQGLIDRANSIIAQINQ
jgi:hypothetical protein